MFGSSFRAQWIELGHFEQTVFLSWICPKFQCSMRFESEVILLPQVQFSCYRRHRHESVFGHFHSGKPLFPNFVGNGSLFLFFRSPSGFFSVFSGLFCFYHFRPRDYAVSCARSQHEYFWGVSCHSIRALYYPITFLSGSACDFILLFGWDGCFWEGKRACK